MSERREIVYNFLLCASDIRDDCPVLNLSANFRENLQDGPYRHRQNNQIRISYTPSEACDFMTRIDQALAKCLFYD